VDAKNPWTFVIVGLIAGGIWGAVSGYSPGRTWGPTTGQGPLFNNPGGSVGAKIDSQKLGLGLIVGGIGGAVVGWMIRQEK